MFLRYVAVAHELADDGALFAFGQRVVVGLTGARLGELDAQFFQKRSDFVVDQFGKSQSEWKPRISNGKPSSSSAITGSR